MWRHDQNKGLRTLSAAHVDHTYHIYAAWTRTKDPKILRRNAGISEMTTSTRFIYMRCRNGDEWGEVSIVSASYALI